VSPQPTTIAANKVAAMHFVCWFIENRSCNGKSYRAGRRSGVACAIVLYVWKKSTGGVDTPESVRGPCGRQHLRPGEKPEQRLTNVAFGRDSGYIAGPW
jgi:hypothetical protein